MESKLGTGVPSRSVNSDSLGSSGVPASRPFRVIATESCETGCSDDGSIPTASTEASISCVWPLACRFSPRSLQLRNQIASIECLLEELERFPHTQVVQSGALCRDDGNDIISILWATAEDLHRDYVFRSGDGNRRSAQIRGHHPRAEQLFQAGAAKHDVSVDTRREMYDRKNASISDEVWVSPTQLEAVSFEGFHECLCGVIARENSDVDICRHSNGAMHERGLSTEHVPVSVQRRETTSQ
jgi:hypothetical protein